MLITTTSATPFSSALETGPAKPAANILQPQQSTDLEQTGTQTSDPSSTASDDPRRQTTHERIQGENPLTKPFDKLKNSSTPEPRKLAQRQEAAQRQTEQKIVQQLAARDREVRAHEAAHAAAGGAFSGGISLSFQRGPDGKLYAVSGETAIDTAAVAGDPRATIEKLKTVRAAALAPVQPSAQDRRVAARASQQIVKAQVELQRLEAENSENPLATSQPGRATGTATPAAAEAHAADSGSGVISEAPASNALERQKNTAQTKVFTKVARAEVNPVGQFLSVHA